MYVSVYSGVEEIVADIPVKEDAPGQVPQEDIFAKSVHNCLSATPYFGCS